jgi:hypothetical protein
VGRGGQEAQEQVNKVLQEYAGSVAGTGDAVELLNLYCGADVMEVPANGRWEMDEMLVT